MLVLNTFQVVILWLLCVALIGQWFKFYRCDLLLVITLLSIFVASWSLWYLKCILGRCDKFLSFWNRRRLYFLLPLFLKFLQWSILLHLPLDFISRALGHFHRRLIPLESIIQQHNSNDLINVFIFRARPLNDLMRRLPQTRCWTERNHIDVWVEFLNRNWLLD